MREQVTLITIGNDNEQNGVVGKCPRRPPTAMTATCEREVNHEGPCSWDKSDTRESP